MEEALIKRVMPHSIEAEQSVVGAMLMDKDAITSAGEIISGDDFYQASYGVIFDSMIELFNEGKPVDLITLQERLKEKDVPAHSALWQVPLTVGKCLRLPAVWTPNFFPHFRSSTAGSQ